jgi:hypothetical protein
VPKIRKVYPFVVSGAYLLPIMHQSSLGALLLSAGSQDSPALAVAGPAPAVCPAGRDLRLCVCDLLADGVERVLAPAAGSRSVGRSGLGDVRADDFLECLLRVVDLALPRAHAPDAFAGDWYSILFLTGVPRWLLIPVAWCCWRRKPRNDPKTLFEMTVLVGMGGLLYRFIPTTIAFRPGGSRRGTSPR